MKIYVIMESTGQCDDEHTFVNKAFNLKIDALDYMGNYNSLLKKLHEHSRYMDNNYRPRFMWYCDSALSNALNYNECRVSEVELL